MAQSPTVRPKEGVNPRSTRQLLDELDDLMNQMLSLPVEDEPAVATAPPALSATLTLIEPEEPSAPLPQRSGDEGPSDGESIPRGEIAEFAAAEPKTGSSKRERRQTRRGQHEVVSERVPKEDTSPPVAPSSPLLPRHAEGEGKSIPIYRKPPETTVAEEPIDVSDDMLVEEPFTPFRRESRPLPPTNASWVVRSLVVWDRGFRRFTRRLGPIGWLLRSSFGRTLLGLCGLACWIVALAWLIRDWMQWTP